MSDSHISVIIPVFNSAAYLRETLESVFAQTLFPSEIIVVDDGSTDESGTVAEQCKLNAGNVAMRILRQENGGTASARNYGVRESNGELLAFLDADDLWLPTKLERQVAAFSRDPAPGIVSAHTEQFFSPDISDELRRITYLDTQPMTGAVSALIVRRSAFERIGLFNPAYGPGEWVDWAIRSRETQLREYILPEVLVRRRLHATNAGRDPQSNIGRVYALKAALDRRRALAASAPPSSTPPPSSSP